MLRSLFRLRRRWQEGGVTFMIKGFMIYTVHHVSSEDKQCMWEAWGEMGPLRRILA